MSRHAFAARLAAVSERLDAADAKAERNLAASARHIDHVHSYLNGQKTC